MTVSIIMDEDSSHESYITNWLEVLLEKNDQQIKGIINQSSLYIPYIGIPSEVVKTIFQLANHFEINNTAKYLAVHLFDKLMCNICWKIIQKESNSSLWQEALIKMSGKTKLYVISCIQIAHKMESNVELSISSLVKVLQTVEPYQTFTAYSVMNSELKVLEMLNWSIRQYMPLNSVEVLLQFMGLLVIPEIEAVCNSLLDFSYIVHDELYNNLQLSLKKKKIPVDAKLRMITEANFLFLAAAIVLTSTFITGLKRAESNSVATQLATITKIREEDIWDFAKLLFDMVMN